MNLSSITRRVLLPTFRLGPPIVRDAVFYRPASFNPATGVTVGAETAAACKFHGGQVLSGTCVGEG